MNRPAWPTPAGRGPARVAATTASRAAELEAQAAALAHQMTADLIGMLEATAAQAADLAALTSTPDAVRQLAQRVLSETRPRAASLRQVANLRLPTIPAEQ